MFNLLKAYFYRMLKEGLLVKMGIIFGILTVFYIVILNITTLPYGSSHEGYMVPFAPYVLPYLLGTSGVGILLCVYLARFFGGEFKNGTIRNQICSSHSRFAIYLSANIASIILATIFYFFFFSIFCVGLLPFYFGFPSGSAGNFMMAFFMVWLSLIFVAVLTTSFTFMFGSGFRGGCLYFGLEAICLLIFLFVAIQQQIVYDPYSDLINQMMRWLFVFQFNLITNQSSSANPVDWALFGQTLGEVLVLMIASFGLGYWAFYKRDVR